MSYETALQIVLIAVVTFAVTAGIKAIGRAWKRDLSSQTVPLVALGTALVAAYAPALASGSPLDYHLAVYAIAGWLVANGIHDTLNKPQPPGQPA